MVLFIASVWACTAFVSIQNERPRTAMIRWNFGALTYRGSGVQIHTWMQNTRAQHRHTDTELTAQLRVASRALIVRQAHFYLRSLLVGDRAPHIFLNTATTRGCLGQQGSGRRLSRDVKHVVISACRRLKCAEVSWNSSARSSPTVYPAHWFSAVGFCACKCVFRYISSVETVHTHTSITHEACRLTVLLEFAFLLRFNW